MWRRMQCFDLKGRRYSSTIHTSISSIFWGNYSELKERLLSRVTEVPPALLVVLFRLFANILCAMESRFLVDLLPDIMMLCKVVSMFQDRMIYQAMTSFLLNTSIFLENLTDKDLKDASLRILDNVVAVGCDILNQCSDEVSLDRTITAICNVLIASPYVGYWIKRNL